YHALETGWLLVGAVGCGFLGWPLRQKAHPTTGPHHLLVAAVTACAALLAIAGNGRHPSQPWWSLGTVAAAAMISSSLSLNRRSQAYAYVSTVLAGVAAAVFWFAPVVQPILAYVFEGRTDAVGFEFVVLTLIFGTAFWLWREIESQGRYGQ